MDSREAYMPKYMFYCCIIAGIGAFSNGWTIGSPNVPGEVTHACANGSLHIQSKAFPDCLPMSTSLWGFAVASFCLGGLFGGLIGGAIQTKMGRKKTIILNNIGFISGGILIGCSVHTAMFIIGRILCGISCGLGSLVIPTYLGEVSTVKARGLLGSFNQFFVVVGILLSSAVGLPTANVPLWRLNYAIVAVPAVFQFFTMTTCVESPRWLISVGKIEESLCCLQKLRGSTADVTGEFFDIVAGQLGKKKAIALLKDKSSSEKKVSANVDEGFDDGSFSNGKSESSDLEENNDDEQRAPMNFIEIFKDPVIRKITLIVLFHHTIQQLSGMNAVMYYSTTIFESSVSHETAQLYAIYTTLVNFGMSLVAMAMVDRQGRRVLLLLSEMGTFIFSILLVIGYHYNIGNLLIASVFLYVASFAIGIGPIPWMITSEMTPIYASSSVGAAATAMNWAMNFFIGQVFPVIFAAIQGWSFLIFAIICLISAITTFFFLPETKGRSIESIVHGFHK